MARLRSFGEKQKCLFLWKYFSKTANFFAGYVQQIIFTYSFCPILFSIDVIFEDFNNFPYVSVPAEIYQYLVTDFTKLMQVLYFIVNQV